MKLLKRVMRYAITGLFLTSCETLAPPWKRSTGPSTHLPEIVSGTVSDRGQEKQKAA